MIFVSQMLVSGGLLYYVHEASEGALAAEQQAFVRELHDNLLIQYRSEGLSGLTYEIEKRLQLGQTGDSVISLAFSNGQIATGNLVNWPKIPTSSGTWFEAELQRKGANIREPVGLLITRLSDGSLLLTGHVLTGNERLGRINRTAIYSAFLLSLPVALLIAFLLGRMVVARMRAILAVTDAVRHGDLSHRVELSGEDGEFDRLGGGINIMLDQIETLVSELRMMTDGLAHDLRSPITRLKSVIEHAIIETDNETAATALEKVSAEAEKLLVMLTTALQISRAEAGIGKDQFADTNIAELLADLVEIYGPLAEDEGFEIKSNAAENLSAPLHRMLINQALGNLIENALKYADGASIIELSTERAGDNIILSVADNGPGIAEERREEAISRFGRLDPARQIAGSGLGLSLVQAVAKLHGGTIHLKDNKPGLRVEISFEIQTNIVANPRKE